MNTNYDLPSKYDLANTPTKIEKLKLSSDFKHINVYIKRDDQTGFELSGNKVRKLEYLMYDIKEKGYTHVITCGAVQSNHVRATAACAAKLGIKCTAVLKGVQADCTSNYYMTQEFGAKIQLISDEDYNLHRTQIMDAAKVESELIGDKVYIIPEGASNGLGNLGYFDAFVEILEQEEETFDIISVPVGSCGTYAGLYIANEFFQSNKNILGINIYDDKVDFKAKTRHLIKQSKEYLNFVEDIDFNRIDIRDQYVGEGYGKTTNEVYTFMKTFANLEGILLDPVYTGKAFYGLYQELKRIDNTASSTINVLFIHTGGTFANLS